MNVRRQRFKAIFFSLGENSLVQNVTVIYIFGILSKFGF